MNWTRLKTVLIVALLLTNFVLAVFLLVEQEEAKPLSELERLSRLIQILQSRGIDYRVSKIPEQTAMPKMAVSYQVYDLDALAEQLFDDAYRVEGGAYLNDQAVLRLADNGTVLNYERRRQPYDAAEIDLAAARRVAEHFISEKLAATADYQLAGYQTDDRQTITLKYVQRYQDYFIDNTYMTIAIDRRGVALLERRWINIDDVEQQALTIIPYSEALLGAIDSIEQANYDRPLAIVDVKLGMSLDQRLAGIDVRSGDAMPYYRFTLSNGTSVNVPGLSID